MLSTNEIAISDRAGSAASSNGTRQTSKPGNLLTPALGEEAPTTPDSRTPVVMENADPVRRRIRNPRRGLIYRLVNWVRHLAKPELTAEQRAVLSEKESRKQLQKALIADAKTAESRMINRLKNMGICYEYKKRDGSFARYATVRFDKVRFEPNAIWLHVDTSHLPFGVSTEQMKAKEVIDNLGIAVGHAVSCQWTVEKGIWYVVERASGAMGIPNHVRLVDLWERMPSSKDSFTIPCGLSNNSRPIFESLSGFPHMLIAGSTGSGKSNFTNVVLCTLIRFNTPQMMKLVMVDLKGGMEFNFYKGLPHLIPIPGFAPDGIVNNREDVAGLLNWLIKEGERRMALLTEGKAKNIANFNAHRKNKLPRIVCVIDEWADVMYSSNKKATEAALVNVVQRMRAVGIHVIVCTQYPKKEVLTGLVKGNLPAKFAFSTTNYQGSINIIDNGSAAHLFPEGRAVFQWRDDMILQTPYCPDQLVNEIVEGAISGKFSTTLTRHDVTPDEIMQWALAKNNGELQGKVLWAQFHERGIGRNELNAWLEEWTGHEFELNATIYRVAESEPGKRLPRRLIAIERQEEGEHEETL